MVFACCVTMGWNACRDKILTLSVSGVCRPSGECRFFFPYDFGKKTRIFVAN